MVRNEKVKSRNTEEKSRMAVKPGNDKKYVFLWHLGVENSPSISCSSPTDREAMAPVNSPDNRSANPM